MKIMVSFILVLIITWPSVIAHAVSGHDISFFDQSPVNNCFDDAFQVRTPIALEYLKELAKNDQLYLVLTKDKVIKVPETGKSEIELREINLLAGQQNSLKNHRPAVLTQVITHNDKPQTSLLEKSRTNFCIWPNLTCKISKAIIAFFPDIGSRESTIELYKGTVFPVSKVDYNSEQKDIQSHEYDFNKLYGYEIVKSSLVSNYYTSQYIQFDVRFDYFNKINIHFFSQTTYRDEEMSAEIHLKKIVSHNKLSKLKTIAPFLRELKAIDFYLCRKHK